MGTTNAINITTTGIAKFDSATGLFSATTTTNNAVLLGSTSNAIANLGPTATAGQFLQSAGAVAPPVFSTATLPSTATGTGTILRADGTNWAATTATYPTTATVSQILYASATNVIGGITTGNNGMLVTGATGIPTILAGPGTTGNMLQANAAAAPSFSTATYPAVATGTGTILRADGTNWSATTATYPTTATVSQILYASATNVIDGLTTGNNGALVTSNTGVPSILAGPGTTGNLLQSNAAAAPSFSTTTYPSTNAINTLLYASAANVMSVITAANNSILVTSATGVPSLGTSVINDFTFTSSTAAATRTLTVSNTDNTNSATTALIQTTVGGGTAGDPLHTYTVTGVTSWSTGIDNSVSDTYVIAASTALGTTNVVSMTTAGAVSIVLGNLDITKSASGATVSNTVSNTSNTASSIAMDQLTVAGTSAGDAFTTYTVSGTTNWSVGTDNSVTGDPFVIAASTALGTTNIMSALTSGEINYPLQPAFLASNSTSPLNVTGDATVYTIVFDSEIFDQNNDFASNTFTAPVTGKYYLSTRVKLSGILSTHTIGDYNLVTSNRSYFYQCPAPSKVFDVNTTVTYEQESICDMDAADTSTVTIAVINGTKVVDVIGTASGVTCFGGYLLG